MHGVEWTADAWAARMASGNPVYPYEWAVVYTSGALFKRVCFDKVRTSRDAPLHGIAALRITGPSLGIVEIPAPPGPVRRIVIAATIVGHLGAAARPGVAAWRFGLEDPAGVWGIVLDPAGRVTLIRPPAAGNGRGHV